MNGKNTVALDLFGVAVEERACADAGRVDSRHPGTASQNVVAVVESIDEGSQGGRFHGTEGLLVFVDAEGTVFDEENRVGLDLFGVAVEERACADAGRVDSRHPGTASQNIVAVVESIDEGSRDGRFHSKQ